MPCYVQKTLRFIPLQSSPKCDANTWRGLCKLEQHFVTVQNCKRFGVREHPETKLLHPQTRTGPMRYNQPAAISAGARGNGWAGNCAGTIVWQSHGLVPLCLSIHLETACTRTQTLAYTYTNIHTHWKGIKTAAAYVAASVPDICGQVLPGQGLRNWTMRFVYGNHVYVYFDVELTTTTKLRCTIKTEIISPAVSVCDVFITPKNAMLRDIYELTCIQSALWSVK